jgi:hypothetical protein
MLDKCLKVLVDRICKTFFSMLLQVKVRHAMSYSDSDSQVFCIYKAVLGSL